MDGVESSAGPPASPGVSTLNAIAITARWVLNAVGRPDYNRGVLSLTARIGQAIEQHALLQPGDRVLVAVSGGLDSMVLLRVLHHLAQSNPWWLGVAHFDHQLRGAASRADARFVGRAAAALALDCFQERGDVSAFAHESGLSIEMAARTLRHRFLAKAARDAGAPTVALAHHADDQVELFFLRLFRGAGIEGLAGMTWQGPSPADGAIRLIRPLLEERRADLVQYAREQHVRIREDASNRDPAVRRNRIRHSLLPELRRHYQAGLDSVILRTMAALRDAAAFVTHETQVWQRTRRRVSFSRLPAVLQREFLSLQLRALGILFDFELVERLRQRPGERVSAGTGRFLTREIDGRITPSTSVVFREEEIRICLEGRAGDQGFGGLQLSWRILPVRARTLSRLKPGRDAELFDAEKVGARIVLRHWRRGDRFQPIGFSRLAKLQNLFVNQHLPRARRHQVVVATTAAGEVFWVEGLRIGEAFKLDKSSRRGLKWTWSRPESP